MTHHTLTTRLAGAAVATCLVVTGAASCGGSSKSSADKSVEKAIERATGSSIDIDSGKDGVTIKSKDGEFSSSTSKKLPESWPKDILPVPDGFEISNVSQTKTGDSQMQIVVVKGDGDADKLIEDTAKRLKSKGVEVSMQSTTDDGGLVMGTKDGLNYHVTISKEDDGLQIGMQVISSPNLGN